VACGTGWYLSRIVSIRPDLGLWGFDFNGSDLFPKENAVFITGEVSANFSFPFEDNTFSFISCMDLIEHLNTESLLRLMTEIKRVLKPDGYLYIKAPNPRSLYLNFWDDPTHLRPFTATALKRLFGMYKLKVFKIWSGRGLFGYLAAPLLLVYAIIKRDRAIFAVFIDCLIGMWVGGICQKLD
jgi:SAM-dependent methyltransferase